MRAKKEEPNNPWTLHATVDGGNASADVELSDAIVSQPTQEVKQEWAAFWEYVRRKNHEGHLQLMRGTPRSLYGKNKNEFDLLARTADTASATYTSKIKLIDVNVPYNNGDVKQPFFLGLFWVTYSAVVQNDMLRNVTEADTKRGISAYNSPLKYVVKRMHFLS